MIPRDWWLHGVKEITSESNAFVATITNFSGDGQKRVCLIERDTRLNGLDIVFKPRFETLLTTFTRRWSTGCVAITESSFSLPSEPAKCFGTRMGNVRFEGRLLGPWQPGPTIGSSNVCSTKPVNSLGAPRSSAKSLTLPRRVDVVEQYITAWVATRSSNVLNPIATSFWIETSMGLATSSFAI